ncbi:MAG TPA: ribonuclease H [Polyangia bacterium]|nr:ribonuclease H [Polyangia bacterium]
MAWIRMRFKDQNVWVRADAAGKPMLDGAGRAEMKYRETDEKSYRPSLSNLIADGEGGPPRELPEASGSRPSAESGRVGRVGRVGGGGKGSSSPLRVPGALEVWTDGACSGNPGPMGIGVVVVAGERREEVSEYLGIGTNNIAELTAIERGLQVVAKFPKDDPTRRVRVFSDSAYAIGLLEKGWKAKANQELVARLRKLVATVRNLEFVKVPGHAGVPENERCDELAREAVLRGR